MRIRAARQPVALAVPDQFAPFYHVLEDVGGLVGRDVQQLNKGLPGPGPVGLQIGPQYR